MYGYRERGVVLIVSLIVLVMMTLIAAVAMRTTTLEERMAGNLRDEQLAFQAAEAALRDAETYLRNTAILPVFGSAQGHYESDPDLLADLLRRDWWDTPANSIQYGALTGGAPEGFDTSLFALPRYVIERRAITRGGQGQADDNLDWQVNGGQTADGDFIYYVTALGRGGSDTSAVLLQVSARR